MGLRTGVATVAGIFSALAFSNPLGWIALAAAAVVSYGVDEGTKYAADYLDHKTNRDLHAQRSDIIIKLSDRLWEDHQRVQKHCQMWLDQAAAIYSDAANETVRPMKRASESLCRATITALRGLVKVSVDLDKHLVEDVLRSIVPEIATGQIVVENVAWQPGYAVKILIFSTDLCSGALGRCIGVGGERLRRIATALGKGKIHFVDMSAQPEIQVLQALDLRLLQASMVEIVKDHKIMAANVKLSGEEAAKAIGLGGANIRLACQLLNMKIHVRNNI
jgi:transcription antitermination factor NusA-like protein